MTPTPEILRFACPADFTRVELTLPGRTAHALDLGLCGTIDEELSLTINNHSVILRRVRCVINDGLLRCGEPDWHLSAQTRAALLWRAYRRYSELVGLKRLSGGLSGSDVLVFRPRLRSPRFEHSGPLSSSGPAEVLESVWGSPLLVKTGPATDIFQEWTRSETFLTDRPSPFLARNEEYLEIQPIGPASPAPYATMISSFLGGDIVQAEPFDRVVLGTRDVDRCLRVIDQVFGHLSMWHTHPVVRPLAVWPSVFRFAGSVPPPGYTPAEHDDPWLLFGRFHFRKRHSQESATGDLPRASGAASLGRSEFARGVGWDIPFGTTDHLEGHLLGKSGQRDGLLYRLAGIVAVTSLIHGDLNPRNVLCDPDKVWLIDFQHTGVGPVLADFARLEANFRFWCIKLTATGKNTVEAARGLELLLLDHFHGSDCSLEPVRGFAARLGADPDDLYKIARCITHLRRLARRWCVPEFADGRDYLAVLYLTVLGLLPHAGRGHTQPTNERWVVGLYWVLEETLDHLLGRPPFDRKQLPYHPLSHLSAGWLADRYAPERVDYLCSTTDGRDVLGPVVALWGVLQGSYHHLDAYDHTLTVMAYLEELLDDPIGGLLNPARLDEVVAGRMRKFGHASPPLLSAQSGSAVDAAWFDPHRDRVQEYLTATLTPEARLLLKWCSLLHDVGKPGTRTVRMKAGSADVQFLGHELYGLALLERQLAAWFPDDHIRNRLADLIRNHHRTHQLVGDYLLREIEQRGQPIDDLLVLLAGESQPAILSWLGTRNNPDHEDYRPDLPLLLLHGYADRLATRGETQTSSAHDWATAVLAVLTFLATVSDLDDAGQERIQQKSKAETDILTFADEKFPEGRPALREFGRVMGKLRMIASAYCGPPSELLQYLRTTVTREELLK
jgi:hypothetical protein